jgi:RNA polymerase primary sigma factor
MRDTRQHHRISKEEEIALANQYRKTGDITAIHKLVNANIALVLWLTKKASSTWGNSSLHPSEVVSIGCEHLFKAALAWNPNGKAAFAAFARHFIIRGVAREGDKEDSLIMLPLNISEKLRKLRFAERKLLQKYGRQPKANELAEHTGFTEKRVRDLQRIILLTSTIPLETLSSQKDRDDEY